MQNEKTKKTKWALRAAALLVLGVFAGVVFFAISSQKPEPQKIVKDPTVKINDTVIHINFAITSQEKTRGLCCRDSLAEDHGMLFVYDFPGNYGFWMKDTRIPLDMYWINSRKEIVHIEHSVQPSSYPKSFGSQVISQYILETNAGFAKDHGIEIGDTARFSLPDTAQ